MREKIGKQVRGKGQDADQPDVAERLETLERRSRRQAGRIAELEAQLVEERRLHRRVAELADVMTELVPATARDDDRVRAALATLDEISPD